MLECRRPHLHRGTRHLELRYALIPPGTRNLKRDAFGREHGAACIRNALAYVGSVQFLAGIAAPASGVAAVVTRGASLANRGVVLAIGIASLAIGSALHVGGRPLRARVVAAHAIGFVIPVS